jgi:hypothetical protein
MLAAKVTQHRPNILRQPCSTWDHGRRPAIHYARLIDRFPEAWEPDALTLSRGGSPLLTTRDSLAHSWGSLGQPPTTWRDPRPGQIATYNQTIHNQIVHKWLTDHTAHLTQLHTDPNSSGDQEVVGNAACGLQSTKLVARVGPRPG